MTKQEVSDLLEKNKNSLLKEIQESKELVILLKESTHRKLNDEEKKKVKEQLLDICKNI